jgi:hypothetical protein
MTAQNRPQGLEYLKNVAPLSDALMAQLMDVIERFEDSLTLSDLIGCLELVKTQVIFDNTMEYIELVDDDDGQEGGEDDEDED